MKIKNSEKRVEQINEPANCLIETRRLINSDKHYECKFKKQNLKQIEQPNKWHAEE